MKQTKQLLLLSLMFVLFATSCKKDDPSRTELLTSESGWRFESLTNNAEEIEDNFVAFIFASLDPAEQTPENEAEIRANIELDLELGGLDDCDKDDVITFAADGSVSQTSGAIKCYASEPDEGNAGTWSFNADETIFTMIDPTGFSTAYEVSSMSESRAELVLRSSLFDLFGDNEDLKDTPGYDEFIASEVLITLTMIAN